MSIIDYFPPREALILHTMDDGAVESIKCDVESYDGETDQYWVSYTDPEDEQCCIMDHAKASELNFAVRVANKPAEGK